MPEFYVFISVQPGLLQSVRPTQFTTPLSGRFFFRRARTFWAVQRQIIDTGSKCPECGRFALIEHLAMRFKSFCSFRSLGLNSVLLEFLGLGANLSQELGYELGCRSLLR